MRIRSYNILLLCVACCMMACNEIAEEDRYELLPDVEVKRTVLLEEFTGQMCTNCPEAHRMVGELLNQYDTHLIAVAIHSGVFGFAEADFPGVGLMQPEGDTYADRWGVSTYPAGIVNRQGMASSHNDWATRIRTEVTRDAVVDIVATADTVRTEDGALQIQVRTELMPLDDVKARLQLWITENGIASLQVEGEHTWTDYVHQHVYRASVNGIWGEEVGLQAHLHQSFTHSMLVKENWKPENLRVVAFVYNDSEGVLQATECAIR